MLLWNFHFLQAVAKIARVSKHESNSLPSKAASYTSHVKSLISNGEKQAGGVSRSGHDDDINISSLESGDWSWLTSFEDELCKLLSDYLTHSCIVGFVKWNSLMSTFVCLFIFVNDVLYLIVSPWIWGCYIHKYEYVFSGGTFCCTYTLVINHDLIYYLYIF